ncbi:MAG TPA: carboxypeptidase-like regulatory domain-containing protein, partial [Blastocatellia bacterium]
MRTSRKVSLLALSITLCLALVATTGATYGQAVYGSIFGTVTDASGAATPNATVTITNAATNVSVTTKTNESGNYTQTRLIPGTYRVKVEATSFKAAIIEAVVVNVDTASTVNATLQPGQVTEEITITAESPLLKTDRADVATTFETR